MMVTKEMAWALAMASSLLAGHRPFLASGVSALKAQPHHLSHEGAACFLGAVRAGTASSSSLSPILPLLTARAGLHTTLCPPPLCKTRGSQSTPRENPSLHWVIGELVLWLQTLSLYWLPGQQQTSGRQARQLRGGRKLGCWGVTAQSPPFREVRVPYVCLGVQAGVCVPLCVSLCTHGSQPMSI